MSFFFFFYSYRHHRDLHSFPTRRSSDLCKSVSWKQSFATLGRFDVVDIVEADDPKDIERAAMIIRGRSEEHTSELQSRRDLVCRLLLEKKKKKIIHKTLYKNNNEDRDLY